MYSRDAHPAYSSVINGRGLCFRLNLGGAGNPTIDYGSNWIASVTHAGGGNAVVVTLKDNIFDVIDCSTNWRDPGGGSAGQYSTIGSITNEQSSTSQALTFTLRFFVAGGGASNDPTGKVSGTIFINNGNVTTPGGN